MSRFYKTATPNDFVDFSRKYPLELMIQAANTQSGYIDETLESVNKTGVDLLDVEVAEHLKSDYNNYADSIDSEIKNISTSIQKDGLSHKKYNGRIKELQSQIQRSKKAGKLGAIDKHSKEFNAQVEGLRQTYGHDAVTFEHLYNKYTEQVKGNTKYNPLLQSYGNTPVAEFAKPVTEKDIATWQKNVVSLVNRSKYAGKLTDSKGNPVDFNLEHVIGWENLLTTGQMKGITTGEMEQLLQDSIPPEWLEYFQQQTDARVSKGLLTESINEFDLTNAKSKGYKLLRGTAGLAGGRVKEEKNQVITNKYAQFNAQAKLAKETASRSGKAAKPIEYKFNNQIMGDFYKEHSRTTDQPSNESIISASNRALDLTISSAMQRLKKDLAGAKNQSRDRLDPADVNNRQHIFTIGGQLPMDIYINENNTVEIVELLGSNKEEGGFKKGETDIFNLNDPVQNQEFYDMIARIRTKEWANGYYSQLIQDTKEIGYANDPSKITND